MIINVSPDIGTANNNATAPPLSIFLPSISGQNPVTFSLHVTSRVRLQTPNIIAAPIARGFIHQISVKPALSGNNIAVNRLKTTQHKPSIIAVCALHLEQKLFFLVL